MVQTLFQKLRTGLQDKVLQIALFFGMCFLALVFGYLTALGQLFFVGLIIAFLIGAILIFNPKWLFYLSLAMCLVGAGVLESFANIPQANWLASLLVAALGFSVLTSRNLNQKNTESDTSGVTIMLLGILLYLFALITGAFINRISPAQAIVAMRAYIPFMGIFFILYAGRVSEKTVWTTIKWMLIVGLSQGLFCLIQKFWVAPRLNSPLADYELMLGSFGGSFYTGGYTGEMAVFVFMNLILAFVLTQQKIISEKYLWLSAISAIVAVSFAETKIVFVVFPIMMLVMLYRFPGGIGRQMIKALVIAGIGLAIIGAVYSVKFWDGTENIGRAFFYTFDPNFMVSQGHRGRFASIMHWGNEILIHGDWINTAFGFGPGSSVGGTFDGGSNISGLGNAVKIYGAGLDASAMTKILWDAGLAGMIGFFMILLGAFKAALKLSVSDKRTWKSWIGVAFKAWVIAFVIMLPYQPAMLGGAPVQFLFWFTLGTLAFLSRWQAGPQIDVTRS